MSPVGNKWLIRPCLCPSHAWMDFWMGLTGTEQKPQGSSDPYKQESLCEVTVIKISHCTVKWQKGLLANCRNDLNIHFEVVTRKKPSWHLQRECLSPQVFCWTFSAPNWHHAICILQVRREKSKRWSHSRRHSCPRTHHFIIHAHLKICMFFCKRKIQKSVVLWAGGFL